MSARHVIVGSGIAALAAAEAIREHDPAARITLVSPEPHPFYSRPGLAYLLTGELPERQLAIRSPDEVRALELQRLRSRAASLDLAAHQLVLQDGRRVVYDRLLLAQGAASIRPDFEGAELEGVVRLDGLDDARRVLGIARRGEGAVVVGGGSTALELVEGLHARGLRTHYVLRGERYWSKVLDEVESDIVEARLEAEGVALHRATGVRRALGDGGRLVAVETRNGERIPCSVLAVAVGVRPRLELAQEAAIATERGILTNEYLETTAPDVYAAGDVAQVLDPRTGQSALDALWSSALATGRTAGRNMAGVRTAHVKRAAVNVTRLAGVVTTIAGSLGGADDPDLLTITRGQSERWGTHTDSWTLADAHTGDRLRVLVGERTIEGAVVMGDQTLSRPLARLITEQTDVSTLRRALEAGPRAGVSLLMAFIRDWEQRADAARW